MAHVEPACRRSKAHEMTALLAAVRSTDELTEEHVPQCGS